MARLKVTVVKTNGDNKTLPVLPKAIVAFEQHFSLAFGNADKESQFYWLAWECERLSGAVVPVFDDWLNDLEDVTVERVDAPLGAPSPDSSPDSASTPA